MDVNNFYSKDEFLIVCLKSSIDLTLPGSVFNNVVYFLCANVNVVTADEVLLIHWRVFEEEHFLDTNDVLGAFWRGFGN